MPIVKQASSIVEFAERVPLKIRTTATHYPLRPAHNNVPSCHARYPRTTFGHEKLLACETRTILLLVVGLH
jgi:hypothetical protein